MRLALPGVPHQLCQFHYLREAAHPIFEADRHAKKELKKRVRGIRPIQRAAEAREAGQGDLVRGYCAAVRRVFSRSSAGSFGCVSAWRSTTEENAS